MNLAVIFTRILFVILSIFFMTAYMVTAGNAAMGVLLGAILGCVLIGFDLLFKRFNLRSFNIAIIGLFVGYLMGQALLLVLSAILQISAASIHLEPRIFEIMKVSLFLFGLYLGTLMTLRAADEFAISIPFIRFLPTASKKKDLLLDGSALSDSRVLDLAASGIVDAHLLIPRFLVKELYIQTETQEAQRALETVKKLEALPELSVRYTDTDFPEIKDPMGKMIRLARLHDANILTADLSRAQMATLEGVRVINLNTLSNALKPLMQTGEHIRIKIQRYGKEPRQGVGYLDDGTMVVVNGGGAYIGETIDAIVLSVKHTTSGRMIFCNAPDAEGNYDDGH